MGGEGSDDGDDGRSSGDRHRLGRNYYHRIVDIWWTIPLVHGEEGLTMSM